MSGKEDESAALLAIALPILAEEDRKWIDGFREKHDRLFEVVEPHFTLVFPTFGIGKGRFIDEIRARSAKFGPFGFVMRSAVINNDIMSENCHIFLVPDEGNSHIIKLHECLYSGSLSAKQRIDIDFCSHMTIGAYNDKRKCKELVDEINCRNIEIKGWVESICVLSYADNMAKKEEIINLK